MAQASGESLPTLEAGVRQQPPASSLTQNARTAVPGRAPQNPPQTKRWEPMCAEAPGCPCQSGTGGIQEHENPLKWDKQKYGELRVTSSKWKRCETSGSGVTSLDFFLFIFKISESTGWPPRPVPALKRCKSLATVFPFPLLAALSPCGFNHHFPTSGYILPVNFSKGKLLRIKNIFLESLLLNWVCSWPPQRKLAG